MKLLIDAQLPLRLAKWLRDRGHDVVYTSELPGGNRVTDAEINRLSISEERIVVTKDSDFVDSFLLVGHPWKLLWVSMGNIGNNELLHLFERYRLEIETCFAVSRYVEISATELIEHQ